MRNPARSRNIGLFLFLLGAAATIPAATGSRSTALGVLALASGAVAALGFVYALLSQFELARWKRLDRGEGVIARWSVPPETWRDFLVLNSRLNAAPNALACNVAARPGPDGAVEVVIAEAAVRIGGDFHSFPARGAIQAAGPYLVPGPPPCLEFHLTTFTNEHSRKIRWALRAPIPAGAEPQAERVLATFAARRGA